MSAYITLMTPMTDRECLLSALTDLGFDRTKVEVHEAPVHLEGYMGERRGQMAHVVIRRRHVGNASNDVGFLATATGYQATVSEYDRSRFGSNWLSQLGSSYQMHYQAKRERLAAEERQRVVETQRQAIHERAKKMGYQVKETREGDKIRMVLVKRTY